MLSEIEKTKITFSRALTFRELCWIIILRNCFILWLSLKHITHFTRTSDSVAHYTIKNSLLKNFYAICVCEFVWPPVSFGRDYSCYLINIFSWENLHFEAGWFCIYTYTCVCVCVYDVYIGKILVWQFFLCYSIINNNSSCFGLIIYRETFFIHHII